MKAYCCLTGEPEPHDFEDPIGMVLNEPDTWCGRRVGPSELVFRDLHQVVGNAKSVLCPRCAAAISAVALAASASEQPVGR